MICIYLSIYIYKTLLICIPNIYIKILKTTVLNCKIHKALICQKFCSLTMENASEEFCVSAIER